jgi:hypothetical protein
MIVSLATDCTQEQAFTQGKSNNETFYYFKQLKRVENESNSLTTDCMQGQALHKGNQSFDNYGDSINLKLMRS